MRFRGTRTLRRAGAALAAAAMVTTAVAGQATAQTTDTGERGPADVAVHHADTTDAAAWTPQRMRSAVPMDKILELPQKLVGGVMAALPEVLPSDEGVSLGDEWTGGGKVTKTSGRVFFSMDGQDSSCSGNVVESENRSVVVTAGHCVKYQGAWHKNWTFVPGYDNGKAPYGEWSAQKTLTTPQWESGEDMNHDVGAAVLEKKNGKSVADTVGAQKIGFNGERGQEMYSFGYPAAPPYDGSALTHCAGPTFDDPVATNDHGMACGMTGGSSGGPWFSSFDPQTGEGVQSSVNSFGYTFLPNVMFGPYFGDSAKKLYEKASTS